MKQQIKVIPSIQRQQQSMETGVINYPDKIGSYNTDTIINFQGKKYKCKSNLKVKFCNDKGYIPNGLYGYLAWSDITDDVTHLTNESKQLKPKRVLSIFIHMV